MSSLSFDDCELRNNLLILRRNSAYGKPRRFIIPRDQINYVAHGRHFDGRYLVVGAYMLLASLIFADNVTRASLISAGALIIVLGFYRYYNSRVIIQTSSSWFYSGYCADVDQQIVSWFGGDVYGSGTPYAELTAQLV